MSLHDVRQKLVNRMKDMPKVMEKPIEQEAAEIVYSFLTEVEQSIHDILKVFDVPQAEDQGEIIEFLTEEEINVQFVGDRANRNRAITYGEKEGKFVVGYVTYVDLKLYVTKRILLENEDHMNQAVTWLASNETQFNLKENVQ